MHLGSAGRMPRPPRIPSRARVAGVATSGVSGSFALQFPSNSTATNTTDPYAVIEFANPQSSGLPIWGAGNAGVTVIRKLKTKSTIQPGYNAFMWWSDSSTTFDSAAGYWGAHPYPVRGYDTDNNYGAGGAGFCIHEIALDGLDIITSTGTNWAGQNATFTGTAPNDVPSVGTLVTANTTYIQGLRITYNSATDKDLEYYFNLPNVDSANKVAYTTNTTNGNTAPANPKVTIGDSPWYPSPNQHERADCILDGIKIFNAVLSEADMLSEAADFSRIVTSAGASAIWWGRNGFDTGHATNTGTITCHFGTGRAFTIVNPSGDAAHQISLVSRI